MRVHGVPFALACPAERGRACSDARAGTQLACSPSERCEAICIIFRIARVPVARRHTPYDAWSESNPVLPPAL